MKLNKRAVDIHIDKLTNSIVEISTGDSHSTLILPFNPKSESYRRKNWKFNWEIECKKSDRKVYQLVIKNNLKVIHGLISLSNLGDHIHVNLIESSSFNFGKKKKYEGVPANLFAFACYESKKSGYNGEVAFIAKSKVISHYVQVLNCKILYKNHLLVDEKEANLLIKKYFKNDP